MHAKATTEATVPDLVTMVEHHLTDDSEVLRSAGARALAALGEPLTVPALVGALLDQDPDVRADAMTALVKVARPADIPTIIDSLQGDPVAEVKIAAIDALGQLRAQEALPVLCRLARERAEDTVNWEDDEGGWDAWLDVQVAAIDALGRIGADDAIQALVAARDDELGQDLDETVFAAVAQIPGKGIETLTGYLEASDTRTRRRALAALVEAAPERLRPWLVRFLNDPDEAVRVVAVRASEPQDEALTALVSNDPSASVRREAVRAFGRDRPDLARAALDDPAEEVRAAALEVMPLPSDPSERSDFAANLQVWLPAAGSVLAPIVVRLLAELADTAPVELLVTYARDPDKPLASRIEAVRQLGVLGGDHSVSALIEAAGDRDRQIRLPALVGLAQRTADSNAEVHEVNRAGQALAAAIAGTLLEDASVSEDGGTGMTALSDTRDSEEGTGPSRIRITRDGEIVEATLEELEKVGLGGATSTLASVQAANASSKHGSTDVDQSAGDEDDPLHGGDAAVRKPRGGGRNRAAVDGPDHIVEDLRLNALQIAARSPSSDVHEALLEAVYQDDPTIRTAALGALAQLASWGEAPLAAFEFAKAAANDPDPGIRIHAAHILASSVSSEAEQLYPLLDDPVSSVRATVLRLLGPTMPERLTADVTNRDKPVRDAAVEALIALGDSARIALAAQETIYRQCPDSLARLTANSTAAREVLARALDDRTNPAGDRYVCLQALADFARG